MSGRPGSADNNDNDGANGNARGNSNNVGASDRQVSPPPLDIYALFVVIIFDADADKGPPFILEPDPAGLFSRAETHDVPYPPGLLFANFISPRNRKQSIKIRRDRRRRRRRGNK